ncbi:MAG: MFS transporter [Nitratireductor sp.]
MSFFSFLRENLRWLGGGFLLTFFASFGQTFYISLSAGEIRGEYGLSHGEWGGIYMLSTLASALTLPWLGQLVDRISVSRITAMVIVMLAAACALMAVSHHLATLVLAIYCLRLFGQGMMTHIALTAMGKWYAASRGRAVSIASIGANAGEAIYPLLFVVVAGALGWRNAWFACGAALVLVALPVIFALMSKERMPRNTDPVSTRPVVRDWTRGEVLRDPLFWIMLAGVLAPPFIGTTIFFHQVHLVEIRGWSLAVFASSFSLMSVMVISCALVAGYLVDRFTALRILPVYLIPLAAACFTLGSFSGQWAAFAFMALLGVSYGFSTILLGALWPEVYGTANLGAIRATIVAVMVFATAMGPGLTGWLIDLGVWYPHQILAMGIYCIVAAFVMFLASRAVIARLENQSPSDFGN